MRFGSSTLNIPAHSTVELQIYARILTAYRAGHGVVRIPHTVIAPLDISSSATIRQLLANHQLRCVIHAPIISPLMLLPQLTTYTEFFERIGADDGVIICHMTAASQKEWQALYALPDHIRRHLAIEHTNQPIDELCGLGMPIIFDWLHYHIQSPWPYHPLDAAMRCALTWHSHRPLIHLSSPDTADHGMNHKHIHGRHSDYLDWATLLHFVGQLTARVGEAFDIEIEARAGTKAVAHFLQQCQQHTPPHWQHLWKEHR